MQIPPHHTPALLSYNRHLNELTMQQYSAVLIVLKIVLGTVTGYVVDRLNHRSHDDILNASIYSSASGLRKYFLSCAPLCFSEKYGPSK